MPEHVHLLVSEPDQKTLADAMHYIKLSFAKRFRAHPRIPHPTVPQLMTVPQVRGRSVAPNLGSPDGSTRKGHYPVLASAILRPQRRGVNSETALSAQKPSEAWTDKDTGRLEVEQFPPLVSVRLWPSRHRYK